MLTRRLMAGLAMIGFAGLAACNADEADDADMIMQDTIVQEDIETVEVPVETTDTAVVRTEVSVDTAIDVDTLDRPM
jgi:hypothetical protein